MGFYWETEDAQHVGIVKVSVASLRSLPVFQSELINQLWLGTIVPIFEERNEFYYIQNWDGYEGWVNRHFIQRVDRQQAHSWQRGKRIVITENYGVIRELPDSRSTILTDLVPGNTLKFLERQSGQTRVELPDGRQGWIENALFIFEEDLQRKTPTVDAILDTARRFLGVPYLWGGVSTKGFDCSGLVQMVFYLNNIRLPRDARQMAHVGQEVPLDDRFQHLKPGDLILFGKTLRRINHVAIYLGNGQYLHARGSVTINSLFPTDPLYEDYLRSLVIKAVRVI
ncbi:MAG: C40 family peptidase [Calditrichaeota bacterium]|nr:C40 family peptidase [Calditrichota bacterium]